MENPYDEMDLRGADLRGTDLSHADLSDADLSDADLSRVNLRGVDLHAADLSRASLSDANLSVANLSHVNLRDADLRGAYLSDANLNRANLNRADLSDADLSCANLSRVNLRDAILSDANLNRANLNRADLSHADLSDINLSRASLRDTDLSDVDLSGLNLNRADLSGTDLSRVDLRGADLRGADLRRADLSNTNLCAAQVLQTDFTEATLTGACIQDWQLGSSTILERVKCDYIFRVYDAEAQKFTGRLPVDPDSFFAPGEFTQRFQIIASALETIDITFTEGIDWQAFFQSFQEMRQQYPDKGIAVQGMEEKGEAFIVRLRVDAEETGSELEQLKASIETTQKQLYSTQLELREVQGQNKVYREMMGVVKTLAGRSMGDQHFYGSVGNVAGTNYGAMTATINQNQEAINQLMTALRISAQAFPPEQKEEVMMELDDLAGDLSKPETQEPKRIGKRLKRIMAAGTAAAAIAGGAATFSENVNAFTENVIELGEKVGLVREDLQGNQDNTAE
ncbi:MAG: pentapeptide repeat-containing protein [Cyanobacteria bacterium J06638_22]